MAHIVYTTSTGSQPVDHREPEAAPIRDYDDPWDVPFCFVCSRCTDHVGEHDDLVEAGRAYYDGDNVWPVENRWGPRA